MILSDFRAKFPEFVNVSDALIGVNLAEALAELDKNVWNYPGPRFDAAHGYLTAHKLALTPYGQAARLDPNKNDGAYSTYQVEFKRLVF